MTDILVITDTISICRKNTISAPLRHDTDNIDIGNIMRYFRYIDPSLVSMIAVMLACLHRERSVSVSE